MGFKIDLTNNIQKVCWNGIDLSSGVMRVDIIYEAGGRPYALLKVGIDQLNGADILPFNGGL